MIPTPDLGDLPPPQGPAIPKIQNLLTVRDLVAGYAGAPVLRGIDLTIAAGSVVAVLGPNGAGKTTLLRTLSGLLAPTQGSITFDGRELAPVPVERRVRLGIACVPEGRGVIEELTVAENLRLGGLWRRTGRAGRGEQARALAEVYGLFEPLANRRDLGVDRLSGGERQMLAIGRALLARPRLMLLDEPSLGLAPRLTAQLLGTLRRLADETGLAVLLAEQNVPAALAIADEAVVLSLGRVARAGSAAQLREDPSLRQTYLGSA